VNLREDIESCIKRAILHIHVECFYCGATPTTIDHIHPVKYMGTNHLFNLVAACQLCNTNKGCLLLEDHHATQAFEYTNSLEHKVKEFVMSEGHKHIRWGDYLLPQQQKIQIIQWWQGFTSGITTGRFIYIR